MLVWVCLSCMHFLPRLLQILSPEQGRSARTTERVQRGLLLAADVGADKLGEGLRRQMLLETVCGSTDLALGLGEAELALLRLPRAVAGSDGGSTPGAAAGDGVELRGVRVDEAYKRSTLGHVGLLTSGLTLGNVAHFGWGQPILNLLIC